MSSVNIDLKAELAQLLADKAATEKELEFCQFKLQRYAEVIGKLEMVINIMEKTEVGDETIN